MSGPVRTRLRPTYRAGLLAAIGTSACSGSTASAASASPRSHSTAQRFMNEVPQPSPRLTDRFFAAGVLANQVHGGHRRLGTQIPYAAHLLIVAGLVLEDGGDEAQAIAALLHDVVEDGGGRPMLERIRAEFGDDVAWIVESCSDSLDPFDSRTWRERKEAYLAHLPAVTDDSVLRVALADKVHNAVAVEVGDVDPEIA